MRKVNPARRVAIKISSSTHLPTNGGCKSLNVNNDVQQGFANIRIKFSDTGAKTLNICGQQLVWIGDPIIQIVHFVVGKFPKSQINSLCTKFFSK
jgi:hypothetical protein